MQTFTVAQFVEFLNTALSSAVFPEGAVIEGEVAEYRVSQGKWIWFLLKDEDATVSCFATVWQLKTPLEDGMQVRIFGAPKVHPKSGKFSVNVQRVELVGEGALRRAFELLKKRLGEEGLFAPERKRAIPRFPARIGLIASGESAAYSDFLRILANRWGGVEVNHVHTQVQGRDAVDGIVSAFARFNAEPGLADVIVLTRGGGSLEDLQAFNSEEVARAVFGSKVPVVVGVGHERDESLADYVADVRASTPSNAAELVVPDREETGAFIDSWIRDLTRSMEGRVAESLAQVEATSVRLESYIRRGVDAFTARMQEFRMRFQGFVAMIDSRKRSVEAQERMLHGFDPREVLKRGYAVVRSGARAVKDAAEVKVGDELDVQLHKGALGVEVRSKK